MAKCGAIMEEDVNKPMVTSAVSHGHLSCELWSARTVNPTVTSAVEPTGHLSVSDGSTDGV